MRTTTRAGRTCHFLRAIGGAYGTRSKIGHALAEGIPVVGLNTWEIAREGSIDLSIIEAVSPVNAVEKAVKTGEERIRQLKEILVGPVK